jgi:hypothetical protein
MNNFTKIQEHLTEASEVDVKSIPKYIPKEIQKMEKILNKKMTIDEKSVFDGIHGIITGIKVSGNGIVKMRFTKDSFSKLAKIKGLRWLETDKDYIIVGWDHQQ